MRRDVIIIMVRIGRSQSGLKKISNISAHIRNNIISYDEYFTVSLKIFILIGYQDTMLRRIGGSDRKLVK